MRPIVPFDLTVGVNVSRGAEFLELEGDAVARSSMPVGTGNSPPARNSACWPEMAVSVGSASVRTAPRRSSARSVRIEREAAGVDVERSPSLPVSTCEAPPSGCDRCRGRRSARRW